MRHVSWLLVGLAPLAVAGLETLELNGAEAEARIEACDAGESCDTETLADDLFTTVVYRWVTRGAVDRQSVADLQFVDAASYAELPPHLQSPASAVSLWLLPPAPPRAPVVAPVAEQVAVAEPVPAAAVAPAAEETDAIEPVPAPVVASSGVLRVPYGEGPKVLYRAVPEMSDAMRKVGGGECIVVVTVNEQGRAGNIEPSLCGAFDFGPTAHAVKRWRWEPYLVDGVPTPVQFKLKVKYMVKGQTSRDERQAHLGGVVSRYGFLEPSPDQCVLSTDLFQDSAGAVPGTMGTSDLTQCFALPKSPTTRWPEVSETTDCTLTVRAHRSNKASMTEFLNCPKHVQPAARSLVRSWMWAEPTYGNGEYELRLRFHVDEA